MISIILSKVFLIEVDRVKLNPSVQVPSKVKFNKWFW